MEQMNWRPKRIRPDLRSRIGYSMTFAQILLAHHVVCVSGRPNVRLRTESPTQWAFLADSLIRCSPFHLRRFGCFSLNCEMIYYICTFIAATNTLSLTFLARTQHYTNILLRHLSNAFHLPFVFVFSSFLFYLFVFLPPFLAQKQSRYVCVVRWLLDNANSIHS